MPISGKAYLLIAILIGGVVFLLGMVQGEEISDWANDQQTVGGTSATDYIFKPVVFVFDPDTFYVGAVIAGLLWPVTLLWCLLVVIGLVIGPAASTTRGAQDSVPGIKWLPPGWATRLPI